MLHDVAKPLLFVALLWWTSTGVVLWLTGRPPRLFGPIAVAASLVAAAAMVALVALRDATFPGAAYAGFAVGVALWAWHEVMFLLGFISGPRKSPCPPGVRGFRRFLVSAETVIHHELAIALHGAVIIALSWGAANQAAAWTYCVLWGMRISAKLVVFSGAPHLADHFLPSHLAYLATYFSKRSAPSVLWLATAAAFSVALFFAFAANGAATGAHESAMFIMLAGLAGLAAFEHAALGLPFGETALFAWAAPPTRPSSAGAAGLHPITDEGSKS